MRDVNVERFVACVRRLPYEDQFSVLRGVADLQGWRLVMPACASQEEFVLDRLHLVSEPVEGYLQRQELLNRQPQSLVELMPMLLSTEQEECVHGSLERAVAVLANTQGLNLMRHPAKDPEVPGYGTYHLADANSGALAVWGSQSGFGLSLNEVLEALAQDEQVAV